MPRARLDDADALRGSASADEQALSAFYREHLDKVMAFFMRLAALKSANAPTSRFGTETAHRQMIVNQTATPELKGRRIPSRLCYWL